jgi:hypothetical protein
MSELFPQSANEYALERVARALSDELPDEPREGLAGRAQTLWAIAERYGIPFEAAMLWMHTRAPEKQWSGAEFRRWCEKFAEAREEKQC